MICTDALTLCTILYICLLLISGRIAAWSDDVLDNEREDNSVLSCLPDGRSTKLSNISQSVISVCYVGICSKIYFICVLVLCRTFLYMYLVGNDRWLCIFRLSAVDTVERCIMLR